MFTLLFIRPSLSFSIALPLPPALPSLILGKSDPIGEAHNCGSLNRRKEVRDSSLWEGQEERGCGATMISQLYPLLSSGHAWRQLPGLWSREGGGGRDEGRGWGKALLRRSCHTCRKQGHVLSPLPRAPPTARHQQNPPFIGPEVHPIPETLRKRAEQKLSSVTPTLRARW